ncbi:MAG: phage tail protein [Candidatus Gastranaerophilales bacterium]|nr:phage tail protein [Candidatus Gastranaerophilales bacterium]
MTVYSMILTNIGLSKIAAAISTGTQINLTQIAVGDSNGAYYEPSTSQTTLVHEVHRFNINNKSIDPQNSSKIIIEGIIPASIGGFSIREIGIFDNVGSLIATGKFPLIEKPNPVDDSAVDLYVKEYLVVSNSSAFDITVDPNIVTASINYVANEITDHDNAVNAHQDRWLLKTEVVTTAAANKVLTLNSSSKLPASITGSADGNAATATRLYTSRTLALSGDVTGSASFNGSANATIASTLANSGATAGTYKSVTVDVKGRVTAGTNPTTISGYGITDAVISSDVATTATANKILKLDANSKLPASITGDADGNAATATKIQTARTISLTGDVTGSVSFDGSANAAIASTLANSGATAGTYKSVTVDAKGRVTTGTNPTTLSGYGITDAVISSDVVTSAAANKILKLDANSKLPASITGDADTVDGCHAGTAANNVLKLDSSGKVPTGNLPTIETIPVGSVFWFAKNTAPTGYLKCNGAAISKTTYSNLYAIIGDIFATLADISTTAQAISGGDYSGYPKANVFDNNFANIWASSQTGASVNGVAYLGQDFGVGITKQISQINLTHEAATGYIVSSAKIQYSSNGTTWTDIQTVSLTTGLNKIILNSYPASRFIRVLANSAAPIDTWHVMEIECLWLNPALTTFNIPDLRGEFIRGWDDARGIDASRVFGSAQSDMVGPHTQTLTLPHLGGCDPGPVGNYWALGNTSWGAGNTTATIDAMSATETRPRNIALLPCIKY